MNDASLWTPDPALDLVIERTIDVPRDLVWAAWTKPEHLQKWYCPAPWVVAELEMDLRPGGIFRTLMRGPEGEEHEVLGCYLELVPLERLVWTNALLPGFRPATDPFLSGLTGIIRFEPAGSGTRYTAMARHREPSAQQQHADMGFYEGWGAVTDQLEALVKTLEQREG